jgi:hypothetical protein
MTDKQNRKAWLPPEPQDFIVSTNGKERPWLSRIVGLLLAPVLRWRLNRQMRKARRDDSAA